MNAKTEQQIQRMKQQTIGCPAPRPEPDASLLPNRQPEFHRTAEPKKAYHHGTACGYLVHHKRGGIRQNTPLQRQPLSHDQLPRPFHERDDCISVVPVRQTCQRQEKRTPCRTAEKRYSALPRPFRTGETAANCQPKTTANRKTRNLRCELG